MEKLININGKDYRFRSSASIPRLYRLKFKRDIFVDLSKLTKDFSNKAKDNDSNLEIESLEIFENVAYLMNKHGDSSQPDDINEWLEQFETFDIYQTLPEILELWISNKQQLSTEKKNQE